MNSRSIEEVKELLRIQFEHDKREKQLEYEHSLKMNNLRSIQTDRSTICSVCNQEVKNRQYLINKSSIGNMSLICKGCTSRVIELKGKNINTKAN